MGSDVTKDGDIIFISKNTKMSYKLWNSKNSGNARFLGQK